MADVAADLSTDMAPRPAIRRVYTQPVVLGSALLLAIALIVAIHAWAPDVAAVILIDKNRATYPLTVQNAMWLVLGVGFGELLLRYLDARAERRELANGYLPEDGRTILQLPDLRHIAARVGTASQNGTGERYLPRLIQRVIFQFQSSRSVDQSHTLLNSSLELFLHEIDLRYSMIRYVVWVIPTLGFIGTVIGISLALAFAGAVDIQDPTLLAELTKRLAVAFNTTLLALVMSAILVLIQHVVQAQEERALNRAGQYCLDNLINRLYEH